MADTNLLVLAREYKKLREEVKKVLSMPKGDKGDQGEKGEKGDTGDIGPQGFPGRDGKDGINGYDGSNGRDGVDGKDGKDGLDGVGVQNAYIDFDNSLVIVLTDGTEVNAGFLSQETKDNIVATFKQGAQTLNELLPTQTGNSGKFLKTNGTDVSWDTLDGSDINLSSPPVIGNTTPNAATFTTLTATGQTSLGGAAGSEGLRVTNTASSVNWLQAAGSTTGNLLTFSAQGADTNVGMRIQSKGTGIITFSSNSSEQLRISGTASAVNYVQVTGAATGAGASALGGLLMTGSDASPSLAIGVKGTGGYIAFYSGAATNNQAFRISAANASNTGNLLQVSAAASTYSPVLSTLGFSDSNVGMVLRPQGTGAIDLAAGSSGVNISNGGTVTAITRTAVGSGYTSVPSVAITAPTTAGGVQATASATGQVFSLTSIGSGGTGYTVNDVLTVSGTYGTAATITVTAVSAGVITAASMTSFGAGYTSIPANPAAVTGGTGTGATFNLNWGISSTFTITNAGSGYVEQPTVTFSGGGGSGAAAYATVGGTTSIRSLGTNLDFFSTAGRAFQVYDNNSGATATYWSARGATTGNAPVLFAQGETNTPGIIATSGTGSILFRTAGNAVTQLAITHTASAVNYVQVTGSVTSTSATGPTVSVDGSSTNVALNLSTKGLGSVFFPRQRFNYFQADGANSGSSPALAVAGGDANIDLALTPKGTGLVRFGTRTASADAPITGYIEIKDSGGTTRRLAVIG